MPTLQDRDLVGIHIDPDDLKAQFSHAGCVGSAEVAGADNRESQCHPARLSAKEPASRLRWPL